MKRAVFLAAAAGGLLSAAAGADETGVLAPRHTVGVSSQNFEIEARVALYQPQVDSDPKLKGATPYATTFGTTARYEVGLEFDWQALRIPEVGTLGPAFAFGYTQMNGNATIVATGKPSAESTSLTILPMYLVAVFRVDALDKKAHIPLVPYVKAGLGYALWRASNTAGTSIAGGQKGEGYSLGTQLAAGVGLNLGVFDPNAARQLDESTGINNTYLFGEFFMSSLNGIGQTNALYVGTNNVAFGLAFEF